MLLSQKSLQVVTFLGVLCLACLLASENTEKVRSVAETQLMHDTGKMIEEISRQRWLQGLLERVHNPGRRTNLMLSQNKERSVAEAQLMHDKGKTIGEITRQRWLQGLLGAVLNPGRRDVPPESGIQRELFGIGKEEHQRLIITKKTLQNKQENMAQNKNMSE
ncbi:parathyroid hormone [Gastrophryne carolinensis]